ncbi:hypothetical protein ACQGRJ_17305 [Bacillus atrophaeus]|uniref:hypothetical protein n=1 Tax=Bacillus atrophaeus TaxID=1452 RepID=UPI003CE96D6D
MDMVNFSNEKLKIGNIEVNFQHDILEIKELNDIIIVVLKLPPRSSERNNVYGVSKDGHIIWRISGPDKSLAGNLNVPYVGVSIEQCKRVAIIDFAGRRFFINEQDGTFLSMDIVK